MQAATPPTPHPPDGGGHLERGAQRGEPCGHAVQQPVAVARQGVRLVPQQQPLQACAACELDSAVIAWLGGAASTEG
jgi:hypothetical protein